MQRVKRPTKAELERRYAKLAARQSADPGLIERLAVKRALRRSIWMAPSVVQLRTGLSYLTVMERLVELAARKLVLAREVAGHRQGVSAQVFLRLA